MGKLQQIEARYDAREDRLALRLVPGDGPAPGFWLTRRAVKSLLAALQRVLATVAARRAAGAADPDAASRAMLAFEAEAARSTLRARDPAAVASAQARPAPVLARRLALEPDPAHPDRVRLSIAAGPSGPGIVVTVPSLFLHRLRVALVAALGRSGWDLDLAHEETGAPVREPDSRLN